MYPFITRYTICNHSQDTQYVPIHHKTHNMYPFTTRHTICNHSPQNTQYVPIHHKTHNMHPFTTRHTICNHSPQDTQYVTIHHKTHNIWTDKRPLQKHQILASMNKLTNYKLSYVAHSRTSLLWFWCTAQSAVLTLSATPPGRMVLTTTPVLRPPIIPNPNPEPSFIRSITSTCAHSVFSCENKSDIQIIWKNALRCRWQFSVERQYLSIKLHTITTHKNNMGQSYN